MYFISLNAYYVVKCLLCRNAYGRWDDESHALQRTICQSITNVTKER